MAEHEDDAAFVTAQARSSAGARLRAAREAAGLTLVQMAQETKIPVRMLTLIEAGDYAALPGKAYATGFTRTCARALGLDEQELVADVRHDLDGANSAASRASPAFEPGDPARVPSARFAWLAAVAALVMLAAGLMLWRSYYAPAVSLPPLDNAMPADNAVPADNLAPAGNAVPGGVGPAATAGAAEPVLPAAGAAPLMAVPPGPAAPPVAAGRPAVRQPPAAAPRAEPEVAGVAGAGTGTGVAAAGGGGAGASQPSPASTAQY